MGGIGSGARPSTHIGNVEDTLALDIRALRRLGVVRAGECTCDTVHWSIGGLSLSSARLRIDLSDIERGGVMAISADMPGGTIKQHVAIEMLPSPFGGHRCYFICPFTARRCEVIYYAGGRFGSREAQRLSYAVQGMNECSRARRKAAKLRSRLSGAGSEPRPRGRNRIDMVRRLRQAELEAKTLYLDRLRNLANRSGARRMPSDKHR
ncbi:hypothetical protein U8326_10630 [Tsuneonella sp. CC-YZS046]|uniref:hypothetical protein n=1 Tax=Tsuneonella sp. CC-YZS046 TaxID=3042152 RepID=UPI002D76E80F|nr:hypothetical protein [Tsuneonella sp. CC-YZS046]WRO65512.1 hypothetical protein U8326_10630 [Tsuneonella sp. CC-YZS046]